MREMGQIISEYIRRTAQVEQFGSKVSKVTMLLLSLGLVWNRCVI